ncbi:hypothetical protein NNJEOMEG_02411 [Fundidesulfovibrio magnetotacticus]|uniref:UPF0235 protein NNJEOMEG_02411 n=1 Tax=Fundidesulfovibrio magnetotacticus TaxID=2730080 RepID=A0A6V8LS49_9BACT|nr:DUF167 domain-containing protein [Fundidesulfovibrio magnetotacticus]GFK94564.1 hypothetical protein NNJEOMEG_02411 [Fundidesulfovibrio magnetotacticus]
MDAPLWAEHAKDGGWRLLVWVSPGAKKDEVTGTADGRLKLKLKAPAVDNKANEALLAYMARLLGTPRTALELSAGQTSRRKTLRLRPGIEPVWPAAENA